MSRRKAAILARNARNDARDAQNARFLGELRRTANTSMAAEAAGCSKHTMQTRRRRDPDFAAQWDAAVTFARARLARGGDKAPGASWRAGTKRAGRGDGGEGEGGGGGDAEITRGGEYAVRRGSHGVQVRRAAPGELSAAGERAFLAHLAATANITLSAEAIGISLKAIYGRRRRSTPFGAAMQDALAAGHEALELALLDTAIRSLTPDGTSFAPDDEAIAALPPPLARMTPDQALHLLALHRRAVALGEPRRAHNARAVRPEETDAELLRLLERAEARVRREEGRGEPA